MIRDFEERDRDEFLEMITRFYDSEAVTHSARPGVHEATFEAALSDSPYVRGLMLIDGQNAVGFGLLSFTFATEIGGMEVLIEDLFIDGSARGKGLGTAFFEFVQQEYPAALRYRLEVTASNTKAQDLYTRLGFEVLPYVQMVKDLNLDD